MVTVELEGGDTIEADLLLVAVGRGRPPRLGYEEAGVTHRPRLRRSPTSGCAPASTASTPSATSCPACSSPTAASRRASSSPRRSPASTPCRSSNRHPAGHLLRPRGRLRRAHRGAGPASSTAPTGRDLRVQPRRQRQEPDPRDRGHRQGRPREGRPGRRRPHGRRPGGRAGRRGAARRELGGATPRTSRRSSTPTRPRTRRSARRSSPWPASRCTPTSDACHRPPADSSSTAADRQHPRRRQAMSEP